MKKILPSLQISLKTRLIAFTIIMLLPLLALGVGAFLSLHSMNSAVQRLVDEFIETRRQVTRLQVLVLKDLDSLNNYHYSGNIQDLVFFLNSSQEIDRAIVELINSSILGDKRSLAFSIQGEWQKVQAITGPSLKSLTKQDIGQIREHLGRMVDMLDIISDLVVLEVAKQYEHTQIMMERGVLIIVAIFIVGLGIAVVGLVIFLRAILRPILLLKQGADDFGKGKLSRRVIITSKDELGDLAGTFNIMAENLEKDQEILKELAIRDGLTGLYNSREFHRLLEIEIARSERYKHSLSLLILDIDHFKVVNDMYGHQAGDGVLRALGTWLNSEIRTSDYAARYGGEEFAVILPELTADSALAMAERLRSGIASRQISVDEGHTVKVTVSIGVAAFPVDAKSDEELIAAADRALYVAKQAGRNRVCRAS